MESSCDSAGRKTTPRRSERECAENENRTRRNPPFYPMRALIALSSRERRSFFDDTLERRLAGLLPEARWLAPEREAGRWHEALRAQNPDIVLGGWDMPPLDTRAIEACPGLRYVCYLTGSVRGKVAREFLERGGIVTNWGGTISRTVAECALMLTLDCLRQATRFAFELHVDRGWREPGGPPPRSLFERRVGIHGFGAVALELLKLLRPFGCDVEVWSEPVPEEVFERHGVRRAESLTALFSRNDVVIEAEALTPQSRGSVGWPQLGRLAPGAVFVNIARAAIVEEEALLRLAAEGRVQIGLDVFHAEPLPADYPLRGLRNVTMVPHIGGPTPDRYRDCTVHALDNLARFMAAKEPRGRFTIESYDLSPEMV